MRRQVDPFYAKVSI